MYGMKRNRSQYSFLLLLLFAALWLRCCRFGGRSSNLWGPLGLCSCAFYIDFCCCWYCIIFFSYFSSIHVIHVVCSERFASYFYCDMPFVVVTKWNTNCGNSLWHLMWMLHEWAALHFIFYYCFAFVIATNTNEHAIF